MNPQRKSLRLNDYDYRQPGGYFVTVCTYGRETLFGEIRSREMRLNQYGEIVRECFKAIPQHFESTAVDEFVVMPNHIHGIIFLSDVGARHAVPTDHGKRFSDPLAGSLATILGSFKSASTKQVNALRKTPGSPVWQRNYYEHVIRDDRSLQRIREYVADNPGKVGIRPRKSNGGQSGSERSMARVKSLRSKTRATSRSPLQPGIHIRGGL